MPPKNNPSAPANRVYKSSTPLQQSRFPLARKTVRYGRQTARRITKQETLTQIGFVDSPVPADEDEDDLEIYEEAEQPWKWRQKAKEDERVEGDYGEPKQLKKRRRKTTGDKHEDDGGNYGELEQPRKRGRKSTGAEPASNLIDEDQTTITQLDWVLRAERKETDSIFDIPNSSPQSTELLREASAASVKFSRPAIRRSSRQQKAPPPSAIPESMPPPRTPHRRKALEIPSSESPATPPSRTSPVRGSILKERSVNAPIPFKANLKSSSPSKLSRLRVEDTFELEDVSQHTPVPTTPSKRSSPAKTVRFVSLESLRDVAISPAIPKAQETRTTAVKQSKKLMDEILDSDAESDEDYEDQQDSGPSEEDLEQETCYGEIGLETQKLLETEKQISSPYVDESQVLGRELSVESVEEKTQYVESQRLATQHVHSMAPRTTVSDAFISIQPQNVTKIVARTKDHDFRRQKIPETISRVWIYETSPTQILRYMAVISGAKRPGEIVNENGERNAEFNAKDPACGELAYEVLELYELADPLPWATIALNEWLPFPPRKPVLVRPAVLDQLMANLKPPIFRKEPPVLPLESSTDTQEAEEQLLSTMIQYTQLPAELSSSHIIKDKEDEAEEVEEAEEEELEDEGEADGDTEEDDGEGNGEEEEEEEDEESPHARPINPSRLSTTPSHISSSQLTIQPDQDDEENSHTPPHHPTQGIMLPPNSHRTPTSSQRPPGPSQASTVDLTQVPQSQTPQCPHFTTDIIMESPERPISIFSSTPLRLPTPRPREHIGPDSLIPYSMSSSQLLTRSQMLPASLLNVSREGPPLCIMDSEDEDDDDEIV